MRGDVCFPWHIHEEWTVDGHADAGQWRDATVCRDQCKCRTFWNVQGLINSCFWDSQIANKGHLFRFFFKEGQFAMFKAFWDGKRLHACLQQ